MVQFRDSLVGTARYTYARALTAGAAEASFAGDHDGQQQGTRRGTILRGLARSPEYLIQSGTPRRKHAAI